MKPETINETNETDELLLLCALACVVRTDPVAERGGGTDSRYELERAEKGYRLAVRSVAQLSPGERQVLVRIRAVSRQSSRLYALQGAMGVTRRARPSVRRRGRSRRRRRGRDGFKPGDRVATTFFERWDSGPPTPQAVSSARGGDTPGVLAEYIVSRPEALVKIPDHLTFEEAATLPCAGVTAWNGLFKHGRLQAGQFVLLEGTGGVSIFGLQFAAAANAKPVITSSSDAKLERAKTLGALATINYRTHPEWQKEVQKATRGQGVAHVLEIGGKDTLPKALESLGLGGHVALIGGLSGFGGSMDVGALTGRMGSMTSIYVGSREDFEQMNAFIASTRLKPVIDRVFKFEEAPAAFEYLKSGSHFGKVVIGL